MAAETVFCWKWMDKVVQVHARRRKGLTENKCPICFEENVCQQDQAILPECGHVFCVVCIKQWAKRHSGLTLGCPLCRRKFRTISYIVEGPFPEVRFECIYCSIEED